MKKFLSLVLALSMLLALAACGGGGNTNASSGNNQQQEQTDTPDTGTPTPDPEPVETRPNRVIYGSSTEISGDIGYSSWWTNNATDLMIRELINDYGVIVLDQMGNMVVNQTVSSDDQVTITDNEDGSKTFTVTINEGLTYNNGEPITAADYVASALVAYSPAAREAAAKIVATSVVGADKYQNGEVPYISGIRLLDEYTYSIQIVPDYANYYFGLSYASLSPLYLPMYSSDPPTVKDDGEGAYLDGGALVASEIDAARWIYDSPVSAGPYTLKSLDTGALTATLEINPYYAGNFEGQKPSIQTIVIVKTDTDTQFDAFKTGEIDFLSQLGDGDEINTALDLVDAGGYDYVAYERNGYGKIQFHCDFGPTQFVAVRQAVAYLLDRNEFANTFCQGHGTVVHGPYSPCQWMTQESEELFATELNTYAYDPAKAVELLEADGWTLNADGTPYSGTGTRYKEVTAEEAGAYSLNVTLADGRILMPLHIMWASSENNPVSDLLVTMLANGTQTAAAGMVIEQNVMTFTELLNWMYRDATQGSQYATPTYGMYNMATGFADFYDYAYNWSSDPEYVALGYNVNYLFDDFMDQVTMDMVYKAAPGDDAAYLDYFQQYIIRWNELLPEIPLYSNTYHTVFPDWLDNYVESSLWDFQKAILYANIENAE